MLYCKESLKTSLHIAIHLYMSWLYFAIDAIGLMIEGSVTLMIFRRRKLDEKAYDFISRSAYFNTKLC